MSLDWLENPNVYLTVRCQHSCCSPLTCSTVTRYTKLHLIYKRTKDRLQPLISFLRACVCVCLNKFLQLWKGVRDENTVLYSQKGILFLQPHSLLSSGPLWTLVSRAVNLSATSSALWRCQRAGGFGSPRCPRWQCSRKAGRAHVPCRSQ